MSFSEEDTNAVLARLKGLHPACNHWSREAKTRGRHAGAVFVGDGGLRYFAKRQRLCLKALYVYCLLSEIGVGPKQFFVLARRAQDGEAFDHVVVTQGVDGFCMASDRCQLPLEDAICMMLLVYCFGVGDIPNNTDNWGATPDGRLAIVDFSFASLQGFYGASAMAGPANFMAACRRLVAKYGRRGRRDRDPDGDGDARGGSENDAQRNDADSADEREGDAASIARFFAQYGPWLGSAHKFDALLDHAMAQVRAWVNDDGLQRDWRRSQPLACIFQTLEEMIRFQHIARKQFELFSSWPGWQGTTA